ncbi:hypothetical protein Tco_1033740, partial [Tanacetum coccineum]
LGLTQYVSLTRFRENENTIPIVTPPKMCVEDWSTKPHSYYKYSESGNDIVEIINCKFRPWVELCSQGHYYCGILTEAQIATTTPAAPVVT